MKLKPLLTQTILLLALLSCRDKSAGLNSEEEIWRLGWHMIENSWNENFETATAQFDSLLATGKELDPKFLSTGLELKVKAGQSDAVADILSRQPREVLEEVCRRKFASSLAPCSQIPPEVVENPALQLELIKMYVDDQATRGNIMQDMIEKYDLNADEVTRDLTNIVDALNRDRLREIFAAYGFPDRKLVGRQAMRGIFFIIQHADADTAWQKAQLPHIESAVKASDLDGESYAYLYDRIKVNAGEEQLYGSQFANVDPANGIVELAPTADPDQLDERRRAMGMMPIALYKKLMLLNL
ncbi:DUF6624 domain-containing protein [Flavilitoribacter nigricans]|uniref:Uncharacterized protein n=1 Tax=Flavilitoribacter nigricans (strain ATCC 23147 / DSM 23189 / NBRC 102662 / NCIMB 1420 / SS-2) TaxID=1122177 RepID=A0A2D0NER8_FLAN2|nr:DUF6624 domain-containing protein [Flavilitoribacter nigricans]PHN07014.1 hypothetical protein CRP01_08625 [Flavilitoribacter nigricans DSM 23189 = NBRC 102662]